MYAVEPVHHALPGVRRGGPVQPASDVVLVTEGAKHIKGISTERHPAAAGLDHTVLLPVGLVTHHQVSADLLHLRQCPDQHLVEHDEDGGAVVAPELGHLVSG